MTSPAEQPVLLDFRSYLTSLVIDADRSISQIYTMDGAALYKITPDHYVCISCTDTENCRPHKGRTILEKVLPKGWECFAVGINDDEHFTAHHYGPGAS